MTTVQFIGIAVASLAVLLLIIALVVTRRHDDEPGKDARAGTPSFLDEAPQDTFSGLGKAEHPVEDITLDPALERAAAARREASATPAASATPPAAAAAQVDAEHAQRERQPQPGGLGLDWGPDLSVRTTGFDAGPSGPRDAGDDEITDELQPDDAAVVPAEGVRPPTEGGPAGGGHLVALSDIIVTTSNKKVDLEDPDVRRMLTDLVTFEIDQAAEFRRQGQSIDAILQLTEAEKVSRALGMTESARRIRAMMEEIRGE